ncbi:unnamed protein product, partial [Amoebophrya sp. A120]
GRTPRVLRRSTASTFAGVVELLILCAALAFFLVLPPGSGTVNVILLQKLVLQLPMSALLACPVDAVRAPDEVQQVDAVKMKNEDEEELLKAKSAAVTSDHTAIGTSGISFIEKEEKQQERQQTTRVSKRRNRHKRRRRIRKKIAKQGEEKIEAKKEKLALRLVHEKQHEGRREGRTGRTTTGVLVQRNKLALRQRERLRRLKLHVLEQRRESARTLATIQRRTQKEAQRRLRKQAILLKNKQKRKNMKKEEHQHQREQEKENHKKAQLKKARKESTARIAAQEQKMKKTGRENVLQEQEREFQQEEKEQVGLPDVSDFLKLGEMPQFPDIHQMNDQATLDPHEWFKHVDDPDNELKTGEFFSWQDDGAHWEWFPYPHQVHDYEDFTPTFDTDHITSDDDHYSIENFKKKLHGKEMDFGEFIKFMTHGQCDVAGVEYDPPGCDDAEFTYDNPNSAYGAIGAGCMGVTEDHNPPIGEACPTQLTDPQRDEYAEDGTYAGA